MPVGNDEDESSLFMASDEYARYSNDQFDAMMNADDAGRSVVMASRNDATTAASSEGVSRDPLLAAFAQAEHQVVARKFVIIDGGIDDSQVYAQLDDDVMYMASRIDYELVGSKSQPHARLRA